MTHAATARADTFGREHFSVEVAPGRLGISLGESDAGFVVVCALDPSPLTDLGHDWRDAVRVGDRLVQLEGEDVVHCSLSEVIARLGKLAASNSRRITFARYHVVAPGAPFGGVNGRFDVEKLVQIRAPSGPLGLVLDEEVTHGAFISAFQPLPDGSAGPIEKFQPRVYCGCRILAVNGTDVSSCPREEIRSLLASLRDQEKQLVLYRAAPPSCSGLVVSKMSAIRDAQPPQSWHGLIFEDDGVSRCKVLAVASRLTPEVREGDILLAVNSVDVSTMTRREAVETLAQSPPSASLVFSRQVQMIQPECHKMRLEPGPLGLNLDSQCAVHAAITGFTAPSDASRPAFQSCAHFLPGSFIVSINKLDVHQHSLAEVSQLLMKLRNHSKDIVVGNAALMERLQQRSLKVSVDVPPGPLGLDFDGSCPDASRVAGFFPMADGKPGAIQRSGLVPVGATIQQINSLDVSCLSLAQATGILKKMAEKPKTIHFSIAGTPTASRIALTREIRIRIPPGPLGIDLKSSAGGRVVVDRMNRDQKSGPTLVFDHGGVVSGSELLAIDGFDVSTIGLASVTDLLKALSGFEKVITFSTTTAAYSQMLSPERKPLLKRVVVTKSPLGIDFDTSAEHQAIISRLTQAPEPCEIAEAGIPIRSRVVAIDDVDLRAVSLLGVAKILKDFAGVQKTLTFLLPIAQTSAQAEATETPSSSPIAHIPTTAQSGSPLHRANSVTVASSSPGSKSPLELKRENSMPPAPTSLQRLDIRPLDATRALITASGAKEAGKDGANMEVPAKTQYEITMSTWTGARAQYQLSVDFSLKTLVVTSVKPTSPKGGKPMCIPFAEVTAVDWGKAVKPSPTKGLFRSGSSLAGSSNPQRCAIVTTSGKRWELDMRSSSDRDALQAALMPVLPRGLK